MNTHNSSIGTLFVVSTPIGNLSDFTERAKETLRNVDLVLAEDTRKFQILANSFSLNKSATSLHEQNEKQVYPKIIALLKEGKNVALTTEAGTPVISDPGFRLIRACHENKIAVKTVPGACAAIAALSISGLPPDKFLFLGFLPTKSGKRKAALSEALEMGVTFVCYESPHRILDTLNDLNELSPQRKIFIGRELTKIHEEGVQASASEMLALFIERTGIKGEIVLVVSADR